MERRHRAWMPVATLLLYWVAPAPSAAQPPAPITSQPVSTGSERNEGPQPLPVPSAAPGVVVPAESTGRPTRHAPNPEAAGGPAPVLTPGGVGRMPTGEVNPLATDLTLKPAPLEPTDLRFPINLATALQLSDARPLIVAAAQAGVWVAEAELTHAKVLWIPMLNIGFDYTRHDGGGPDFNKGIMTAPSANFFYGGAGMWGGMDGINVTNAIFEPLIRRQDLNARHWQIQSAKNDALMQTADAYFRIHQWRGIYAGALYSVERGRDLVERIANLARELVPAVEVDRARNMLADIEQQAVFARQQWRVSSADLTQVLRLDPRAVIVPVEHDHTQITLIDPARQLDDLMPIALTNRPELSEYQAYVQAALIHIRQEKLRPFIPQVYVNGFQTPYEMIQAGIFGLGPNSSLNQWAGRDDLSYQGMWQLDAFGIGNLARIKAARGMQSMAVIDLFKKQDMVAADVFRALARVQSAAARVLEADRAMRTAIITFNGNYEGLQQTHRLGTVLVLVNRPQEAVFALQLLMVAFDQYFRTVSEYNRAQFELFHALGYPANEVAALRTPGPVMPVDLARPAYLPPVGNGPPPVSR